MKRISLTITLIFCLLLGAFQTVTLAHYEEYTGPEDYVLVLGWVSEVNGDVSLINEEGQIISLKEGMKISSNNTTFQDEWSKYIDAEFVIETANNGSVVLNMEDLQDHKSQIYLGNDSRLKITTSGDYDRGEGGRSFVTYKPWRMSLEKGSAEFYFSLIDNFEVHTVSTENLSVGLPHFINIPGDPIIPTSFKLSTRSEVPDLNEENYVETDMMMVQIEQMVTIGVVEPFLLAHGVSSIDELDEISKEELNLQIEVATQAYQEMMHIQQAGLQETQNAIEDNPNMLSTDDFNDHIRKYTTELEVIEGEVTVVYTLGYGEEKFTMKAGEAIKVKDGERHEYLEH
ncbi:MAG: hypothetical protein ACOC2J_01755 [bacterium]